MELYSLYALIGDYEKALTTFEEEYKFIKDINDEDNTWDKERYVYGDYGYTDSLARFIRNLCVSFKEDNTDYETIISIIDRIMNNKKIEFMNLTETLTPLKEVLKEDDFEKFVYTLLERNLLGNLFFITVTEHEGMFTRYLISKSSKVDVENELKELTRKNKVKVYTTPQED